VANTISPEVDNNSYNLQYVYDDPIQNIGNFIFLGSEAEFDESEPLALATAGHDSGLIVHLNKVMETLQILTVDMSIDPPTFDLP